MARFKYLGEPPRPWVIEYGPCEIIKVRLKDGTELLWSRRYRGPRAAFELH